MQRRLVIAAAVIVAVWALYLAIRVPAPEPIGCTETTQKYVSQSGREYTINVRSCLEELHDGAIRSKTSWKLP